VHCAKVVQIFHMKSKHVADKMHDSESNFDLKYAATSTTK
jgi:hypothetical protein